MAGEIRANLEAVRTRIGEAARRGGRDPSRVRVVAAVKTVAPERIQEAVDAGVDLLGENYVQEALEKRGGIGGACRWHMIGHLQSNKARQAVRVFDVVETVDRLRIVRELDRCAAGEGVRLEVLVQVSLAGEASKSGAEPEDVPSILRALADCENLSCTGLMTLPPFFDDPEGARPFFRGLRDLRDRLQERAPAGMELRELSMGMSGDYEVAVEEGATLVRIGTALFGPRTY